jgi:hypothetical protein
MLIRMLYITKIRQLWFSLRYADPKVVPHQNQSTMVLIQVSWPEGYTSLSQWTQCLTDFDEVQSSGQHIPINTMFDWFWWDTTFGSTYSNEHNAELILVMYSLLVKIPQNQLCVVLNQICWREGCTYLVRFHQNKSSMVFIKILYVDPEFSGIRVTRCLVYVYVL